MRVYKTKIELLHESLELRHKIQSEFESLMEKYDIEDQVISYDGKAQSPVNGFFDKIYVAETFDDMMKNFDPHYSFIYHNGEYIVGDIKEHMSDCVSDFIVDCYNMTIYA